MTKQSKLVLAAIVILAAIVAVPFVRQLDRTRKELHSAYISGPQGCSVDGKTWWPKRVDGKCYIEDLDPQHIVVPRQTTPNIGLSQPKVNGTLRTYEGGYSNDGGNTYTGGHWVIGSEDGGNTYVGAGQWVAGTATTTAKLAPGHNVVMDENNGHTMDFRRAHLTQIDNNLKAIAEARNLRYRVDCVGDTFVGYAQHREAPKHANYIEDGAMEQYIITGSSQEQVALELYAAIANGTDKFYPNHKPQAESKETKKQCPPPLEGGWK